MQWPYPVWPRKMSLGLQQNEQKTFRLHIIFAVTEGITLGVIALNEFVLLKNLGAHTSQVGLLFQLAVFIMPLTIFLTHFLERVRNKKRMLWRIALGCRLPLLAFAFFPPGIHALPDKGMYIAAFLLIFLLYYLANPFTWPVLNLFTRQNYGAKRYGRLFSYCMMLTQVLTLLATYWFGQALDWDPSSYRYIYPAIGIVSIAGSWAITRMPAEDKVIEPLEKVKIRRRIHTIWMDAIHILRTNHAFADFQKGMMAYGFGFLMALAVVAVYLAEHFHLAYSDIAFYKNIPVLIAVIALPLTGMLIDRKDPRRLAATCFSFNFLYFACLLAALAWPWESSVMGHRIIYFILLAYLFFGVFTGIIGLVWGIGSSYFAHAGEAARYHAIHLSLTGVRGLLAPPLGVLIYNLGGFYASLGGCMLFQLLAIFIMWRSARRRPLAAKAV